jgi:P4 family phage/plasmid primase-like protien
VAQQWYSYDGKIWVARDDDDIAHEVTRELIPVAPSNSQVSGTVSILQRIAHRSDLVMGDVPPEVIILQNGVLNVNTLELFPHDKSLFTTNILPYSYNPQAQCPTWCAFLYDITGQDEQVCDLLQEWLGYLMSNDYSHQKVMMMVGPKRCGKGTIGQIINQLVGDENFTGGDIEALTDNKYLETLPTKTVMFDGDVKKSFTRHIAESITGKLKAISGRDKITVPRLYKSPLNVRLPTRFTIAGNNVPRLFDDSGALASRMLLVPFYKSYYNREDHGLLDKLTAEIEGIAMWALYGLMRLNSNGRFTMPAVSQQEADEMAEQYSPLKRFAAETVEFGQEGTFTEGGDLYDAYKVWALAAGEDNLMPRRVFTASFKDLTRGDGVRHGVKWVDGQTARGFHGVKLAAPATGTQGAFK